MIIFNTNSWHYKLVLYVFGKSFFFRAGIDLPKLRNKMGAIEDKTRKEHPNDDKAMEKALANSRYDYKDLTIYTTPKNINFCPYCRAVVMAAILFPFDIIRNLLPKRKKKSFDIKKSRRNIKILKIVIIAFFVIWGTINLLQGNYGIAIFQYIAGSFQWWNKYLFEYITKWTTKREAKKIKDGILKLSKKKKNPGIFTAYFKSNHDKVCPPVTFVDKNDVETRV